MGPETKKEIRAWFILVSAFLLTISLCELGRYINPPSEQDEMIDDYEDTIRFPMDNIMEEEYEIYIEELEPEIVQKPEMESLGVYFVTAYCPCTRCSAHWGKNTDSGEIATEGRTVAVDPDVIPYGTVLILEGYGEYIAEDCGSAIEGKEIDVYFDSHKAALEFGEKYIEVFIKHKEE